MATQGAFRAIMTTAAALAAAPLARAKTCDLVEGGCRSGQYYDSGDTRSGAPSTPTRTSSLRINPAGVPVERGFGVESIHYRGLPDFGLVKGMGRVGAAISPANGEETYFGPPGFESNASLLARKTAGDKYESQKIAGAASLTLWKNKRGGLSRVQVNAGAILKYNKITGRLLPGGGLSAVVGPFALGASVLLDETVVDPDAPVGTTRQEVKYGAESLTAGVFLTNLALDYSVLTLRPESGSPLRISLATASLIYGRWLATYSMREEDSARSDYDFATRSISYARLKQAWFAGVQCAVWDPVMVGVFYNYYLLREVSAGLTIFF